MAEEGKKIVLEIDLNVANSAKSLVELKKLQKDLNAEFAKAEIGSEQYKKLQVETGLVDKRVKELNADTKALSSSTELQAGSIRDLQGQYNQLANALKSAGPGQKVLGLSFDDAQKKATKLKKEITDFDEKLGNFQGNVGNYGNKLKDASLNTGIFASQTNSLSAGFNGLKSGLNVAKLGFTTLRGAMLAVPIFALIAAFSALVAFFTKTEKGAEQLERAIAGIEAVFDVLIGRAAKLGEALVQLFSGDFSGAANTAKQAFTGIGDAISKAAKEAVNLKQRLQDLEDEELKQSVVNAKRKNEVDLLIKQSKDRTRTESERLALLDKAGAKEAEGAKKEIELAKERLDIANKQLATDIKNGLIDKGNISKEAADAEIAYQNAIGDTEQKLAAIQARKAAFILEENKLREDALKKEQDRQAKMRELEQEDLNRRIANAQAIDKAEQDLANQRLSFKIKNLNDEAAYEGNTEEKRLKALEDSSAAQLELAQNEMLVKLDNEKLLADQRTAILEAYAQKKLEIETDTDAKAKKIQDDAIVKEKADAEKKKKINDEVNNNRLNGTKNALGSAAALFNENSTEYKALASSQALIDTYQAAIAAYKAVVGIPYVGPFLAAAAAGVATATGLATVAKINSVTFADGGIAGGGKQGVIGGRPHSLGGTTFYGTDGSTFEAEAGELLTVVNKHDTARLNNLSLLNSGHGKPFFAQGGIAFGQDGGFGARQTGNPVFDSQSQINELLNVVASMPAPVVDVRQILKEAQKNNSVKVKANLTRK